jgi:acyl-CoA thioester hydrolase
MKTDPRRLQLSTYRTVTEVPPRFGDMDALRHLNNVSLAAIYEEGRIDLHRQVQADRVREKGTRTVVAQVQITYLAEAHYPDPLQIGAALSHVGRTSYVIVQGMFQNGRCVGVADTLFVNTKDGRPHPLAPDYRAALEGLIIKLEDKADDRSVEGEPTNG